MSEQVRQYLLTISSITQDALAALRGAHPPWYTRARGEEGVREIPGRAHEKRVVAYHATTSGGEASDEVPWCSSFVNWCMECEGFEGTDRKNARSWLTWGEPVTSPYEGCVAVFARGTNPAHGHVGFFVRYSGPNVVVLGGNQSNQVRESEYPQRRLLGFRQPSGWRAN